MTGGLALGIAAVPTMASLALMGLADPKRRRAAREPEAPARWRSLARLGLLAAATFVLATAGIVALMIWGAVATMLGWGFTQGLAALPADLRRRGDAYVVALATGSRGPGSSSHHQGWWRWRRALPPAGGIRRIAALMAGRGVVLALACGLVTAVAALSAWRAASEAADATGRLVGLQAIGLYDSGRAARAAVHPCLAVIDAGNDPAVLRGLLSDRTVTIRIDDAATGTLGLDLQRCILSQGGDGATVEREAGATRFTVAPDVVAAVHAAIVRELLTFETLADLAQGTARDLICRHVFLTGADDVLGFVALLQRDRSYAKADDLLSAIGALDRAGGGDATAPVCR